MPLVRTEAIILRTTHYSETSKICRAFTLEHGLQSVIAKGIRRPGNKMLGILEILNHVDLIYYKKRNRSLFTLSQATVIDTFNGLAADLHRYYRASALAEIVLKLGLEEEGNEQIFHLFAHSLRALSRRPLATLGDRTLSYIWGLLALFGYAPGIDSCVKCGKGAGKVDEAAFSVREGGLICRRCTGSTERDLHRVTGRMIEIMSARQVGHPAGLNEREEETLLQLTEDYVGYHIQDRSRLVCWDFLRSLRRGEPV